MQTIYKAIYAAVIAGLAAASSALAQGNGHIGYQAGIVIATAVVTAFGGVYSVTNKPA